jgi:hypothetical protein
MAVALARLFYMVQGINPMTDSTKPRTLKDQLESETADTERSGAVDSERHHGGDWWQLTDAEESVFVIDRERFPRMITVWSCYEAFKNIAYRDQHLERAEPILSRIGGVSTFTPFVIGFWAWQEKRGKEPSTVRLHLILAVHLYRGSCAEYKRLRAALTR